MALIKQNITQFFFFIPRMHVEFQLNEPPLLPFWFTPSQFTGRLHVARDLSSIEYFDLYVPNNKRLNVGMLFTQLYILPQ